MNWFTRSYVAGHSLKRKKELLKDDIHEWCEHVEEDNSLLHSISRENDSFGHEAYGMCEKCSDRMDEEIDNEEVFCIDCKGTFKRKDTFEWKWYDFYAAQGDEPDVICKDCRNKPKHLQRVRNDREDYNWEMGIEDNGYDDDDILDGH